jgi:hypothetical protein
MKNKEIRIKNVPANIHEQLINIAANTGTNLSQILKPELAKICDKYPENMKLKPRD